MKATISATYSPSALLRFEETDVPEPADDEMLVRVHSASVNALDWRMATGKPYVMRLTTGLRKPKQRIRGVDISGRVEAVGTNVSGFKPGDEVFGVANGSFAEYASGDPRELILKPAAMSHEQAAALPIAGVTALMAVRNSGQMQPGQRVLINGAAGGVGHMAVQIAKALGAETVAAVCSTRNVELVRSLGADRVFDYSAEDFASSGERYDLVVDAVGNRSLGDLRRVLAPKGTLVLVGGGGGWLLGPITQFLKAFVVRRFVSQKIVVTMGKVDTARLHDLVALFETGQIAPVIDRSYELAEGAAAVDLLEQGHARGKTVIAVASWQ